MLDMYTFHEPQKPKNTSGNFINYASGQSPSQFQRFSYTLPFDESKNKSKRRREDILSLPPFFFISCDLETYMRRYKASFKAADTEQQRLFCRGIVKTVAFHRVVRDKNDGRQRGSFRGRWHLARIQVYRTRN